MRSASARSAIARRIPSFATQRSQTPGARFAPLANLLTGGGDDRLLLLPGTSINSYGCAPVPQSAIVECASSTATSISARGWSAAEQALAALRVKSRAIGFDAAFGTRIEDMRTELREHLELEGLGVDIVFAPSGTDSMLHASFLSAQLLGTSFVNVMTSADETGSGVPLAATARHFSGRAALGCEVEKGEPVAGFAPSHDTIAIAARDESGKPLAPDIVDALVIDAVRNATAQGRPVLVHAMDCSKTGLRAPSLACLDYISSHWPASVRILVDACQMRLGRARLRRYLSSNFMVAITGSKFFTGPPFSGALLVPPALSHALAHIRDVPQGLDEYTARSSWPASWQNIRSALPPQHNLGEWLRWEAALAEMRAYYAVPLSFRNFMLHRFAGFVSECLERIDGLTPVDPHTALPQDGIDDEEMGTRTIFPFFLSDAGRPFTAAMSADVYRTLNNAVAGAASRAPVSQSHPPAYHLGQPVVLACGNGAKSGALRVSASARLICDAWTDGDPRGSEHRLLGAFDRIADALEKTAALVKDRR